MLLSEICRMKTELDERYHPARRFFETYDEDVSFNGVTRDEFQKITHKREKIQRIYQALVSLQRKSAPKRGYGYRRV